MHAGKRINMNRRGRKQSHRKEARKKHDEENDRTTSPFPSPQKEWNTTHTNPGTSSPPSFTTRTRPTRETTPRDHASLCCPTLSPCSTLLTAWPTRSKRNRHWHGGRHRHPTSRTSRAW